MKLIWGTASLKHRGTNSDDTARHLDPATPEALSLDFLVMWANQFIFTQGTPNLVFCHLQPTVLVNTKIKTSKLLECAFALQELSQNRGTKFEVLTQIEIPRNKLQRSVKKTDSKADGLPGM